MKKPIIGISQGDPNGVGLEVIIKTFAHEMMYDYCIPVVYGNPKSFAYVKKMMDTDKPMYTLIQDIGDAKQSQLNLIVSGNEPVEIQAGQVTETGGKEALQAIDRMLKDAKAGKLDAMVTAPVDKSNIRTAQGFSGHTSYITRELGAAGSLMMLYNEDIRIGLVTEHLPLAQVSGAITKELIVAKLKTASESLKKDFGIVKPKIAVLGLNPHNGDKGTMGKEEELVIIPAVTEATNENVFCFGPYSADGFFGMKQYQKFDLVMAMYHDQGLIPFKSMAFDDGVNYTAGLPVIRTSPDHGTAYDIAGKNCANPLSFTNAVFAAIDIFHQRNQTAELKENPLGYSEFRRERFRLEQEK